MTTTVLTTLSRRLRDEYEIQTSHHGRVQAEHEALQASWFANGRALDRGKLLNGEQLEERYQAHVLSGDRKGQWECHIQPDWLLVWEIRNQELVLVLLNTGTHSDLFSKKYKKR